MNKYEVYKKGEEFPSDILDVYADFKVDIMFNTSCLVEYIDNGKVNVYPVNFHKDTPILWIDCENKDKVARIDGKNKISIYKYPKRMINKILGGN